VLENWAPSKIFGPKMEEVTRGWRNFYDDVMKSEMAVEYCIHGRD
jgi:hypothetical protein